MFFLSLWLQIAFTFAVYPSLILAYMGQAAYLSKHHVLESDYRIGFYVSVPGKSTHHLVNQLKCNSLFGIVFTSLFVVYRANKMASFSNCYIGSCCWKSGNNHRNILHHQAMYFSRLLPKSQNRTHFVENAWSDIYP